MNRGMFDGLFSPSVARRILYFVNSSRLDSGQVHDYKMRKNF